MRLPKITRKFMRKLQKDAKKGWHQTEIDGIEIAVAPFVFPPSSPFSESTHYTVYDQFGNLKGKDVLDIGTGTGILAIKAALAGAKSVEAVDICLQAVACAEYNVRKNKLENKIKVYWSDLFKSVPSQNKYDLIIANLPIIDINPEENITHEKISICDDSRFISLIDPGFRYHRELFQEAPKYLKPKGKITLGHANLQDRGFEKLEKIASESGFRFKIAKSADALGYEWRNYEFYMK